LKTIELRATVAGSARATMASGILIGAPMTETALNTKVAIRRVEAEEIIVEQTVFQKCRFRKFSGTSTSE
jgi:hypothetical protein